MARVAVPFARFWGACRRLGTGVRCGLESRGREVPETLAIYM